MPSSEQPNRDGEQFHRALVACAGAAIIAADTDLVICTWNRAAERMFGRPADQMIGRDLLEIVPEARRAQARRLLARTLRKGTIGEFEARGPARGGVEADQHILLSPVRLEDDRIVGVAVMIRDITARRRIQRQLRQAERMASLGTLAGGVAHHFNNILGGVATFVDYALDSGDAQAMRRALRMTAEAAGRMNHITQNLLSFAEQDHKRFEQTDLAEVVLNFTRLIEAELREHHIELRADIGHVPSLAIDAARFQRVLSNLLQNSEEAMPEGGTITLRLAAEDGGVLLTFADTGAGIPPDVQPLIFEPFFTTKGAYGGGSTQNPGLGLSVAHGIINDLGGTIEVESREGRGATITVRLPVPEKRT
jgi:PAS domain S-box-containing protein